MRDFKYLLLTSKNILPTWSIDHNTLSSLREPCTCTLSETVSHTVPSRVGVELTACTSMVKSIGELILFWRYIWSWLFVLEKSWRRKNPNKVEDYKKSKKIKKIDEEKKSQQNRLLAAHQSLECSDLDLGPLAKCEPVARVAVVLLASHESAAQVVALFEFSGFQDLASFGNSISTQILYYFLLHLVLDSRLY